MLEDDRDGGVAFKGNTASDQFIQNDTDRIDIGAVINFTAARLFGGHVRRSAADKAGRGLFAGIYNASQAEICDDRLDMLGDHGVLGEITCFVVKKDVRGFDITVNDTVCVSVIQPCHEGFE